MTESDRNSRMDAEVQAIREQYAEEDAEAAEAEIAEKAAALDVPLNLRITKRPRQPTVKASNRRADSHLGVGTPTTHPRDR